MNPRSQPRDPRSRLALGCSALARAGQQLSVASSSDQVRAALQNVAAELEADPNLSGLIPVDEIARKCRETARCPDDGALLSGCRLMATSLARRASSLAAEVQQRAKAPQETPAAATADPAQAAAQPDRPQPVKATAAPEPTPLAAMPAHAEPSPPESPAPTPLSPARAEPETPARRRAGSQRFSQPEKDVVVDSRTNRMWLSVPLPAMRHNAALVAVTQLVTAGHRDWRLPTLGELQEVLGEGGLQALRGLGVLPGVAGPQLWSSDLRSRFFGLLKSVGVVSAATGATSRCSVGDASVRTLAVRGG